MFSRWHLKFWMHPPPAVVKISTYSGKYDVIGSSKWLMKVVIMSVMKFVLSNLYLALGEIN